MSATSLRRLSRWDQQQLVDKKMGCSNEHPFKLAEELPLLCGLLLRALGSLLRHVLSP
jgi:hypothetical protein